MTGNFAQALAATTGDIVCLADQDDVWRGDRVAQVTDAFGADPAVRVVASDARLIDAEGAPLGDTLFARLGVTAQECAGFVRVGVDAHEALSVAGSCATSVLAVLLRRNILTGATMAVRRDLLAVASPFPASWVHDEWLAMMAALTGRLALIEDPLIDYRLHGTNTIGAEQRTLAVKLGRLCVPRAARNVRLLARALALAERADTVTTDADVLALLHAKVAHEQMRSSLARTRIARVVPVLGALRRGDYERFGLGLQDVLRDLVQPAGPR